MFKNLLGFIYRYRVYNPLMRIVLPFIAYVPDVNQLKRETKIVVSLSAEEESFDNLEYTLYSIFNQKVKPDNILLWVSNEYELSDLPYSVTKFVKSGLDIRFVEYKASYTKIIYALNEFKDCIIVTADENIYYPKNWLGKLYLSYISNPNDIHVHSAVKISEKQDKTTPVCEWNKFVNTEKASYKYFPVQTGGVLYPPNCFTREVSREDVYKKKINTTWDIWSWVMVLLSDRKIRIVKNHISKFVSTNIILSFKKYNDIIKKQKTSNEELVKLFGLYGNNISRKLNQK